MLYPYPGKCCTLTPGICGTGVQSWLKFRVRVWMSHRTHRSSGYGHECPIELTEVLRRAIPGVNTPGMVLYVPYRTQPWNILRARVWMLTFLRWSRSRVGSSSLSSYVDSTKSKIKIKYKFMYRVQSIRLLHMCEECSLQECQSETLPSLRIYGWAFVLNSRRKHEFEKKKKTQCVLQPGIIRNCSTTPSLKSTSQLTFFNI